MMYVVSKPQAVPGRIFTFNQEVDMRGTVAVLVLCTIGVLGCSDKEKEQQLQSQITQAQNERSTLQQTLNERDRASGDIIKSVNEVYADLEKARVKENKIMPKTQGSAENTNVNAQGTQERLLQSISEIGATLKDNRKKIAFLQTRMKTLHGDITNLNTLLENLKTSLLEREKSIAMLEANVKGLEATVEEKTKLVEAKESTIGDQQKRINTVFYIAGTRDELVKKGVISKEGGFLWGLLGSTTVLTSGLDTDVFQPLDKTAEQTIHVQGKIDEILPKRNPELFATSLAGENGSDLKILQPEKFWQGNYLVVVLD